MKQPDFIADDFRSFLFRPAETGARSRPGSVQRRRERLRRFATGFGGVLLVMLVAWPLLPRRYVASSSIILHAAEQDDGAGGTKAAVADEGAIQSESDRLNSRALMGRVADQLDLFADRSFVGWTWFSGKPDRAKVVETLRNRVDVTRERRSYTLTVTAWDRDAARVAAIVNATVGAYLEDQIARKRAAVEAETRVLEQRAAMLRAGRQRDLDELRALIGSSGMSDRGDGSDLQNQLTALTTELAHTQARVIDTQVRADSLAQMRRTGTLLNSPEILASAPVQHAREMLVAARAKAASLSNETRNLTDQVEEEALRVARAAEQDATDWRTRETLLRSEISKVRSEMAQRRLNQLQLDELRRVVDADETSLADCVAKLKAMIGLNEGVRASADVVARGEPPRRAAFPNPLLVALGSLLAAGLAGAAAATPDALKTFKRRISTLVRSLGLSSSTGGQA